MKATVAHPGGTRRGVRRSRVEPHASAGALSLEVRRHPIIAEIERGLARCGVALDDPHTAHPITIVIGVSGGADSVALLLGCAAMRQRQSGSHFNPIVVHVHHHLRESADEDAAFVGELCARLNVKLHVRHVYPGELPGNVSANARRLRYQALCEVAIAENARFVAVAHQGEDQLETMIASLCRGAGLEGLAGMPWARTLKDCCGNAQATASTPAGEPCLRLIRPLLALRRSDCEDLCRSAGVQWRDDPSNVDATRARARLRRDVLPVLEELWPDAPRRVTATSEILSAAVAALSQSIASAFGDVHQTQWDRKALANVPPAIVAAGLRRAALALAPGAADELNQRHLMQAAEVIASSDRRPRSFDWPGGLRVQITARTISLV